MKPPERIHLKWYSENGESNDVEYMRVHKVKSEEVARKEARISYNKWLNRSFSRKKRKKEGES